jgi:peptidoglycan/xylan/chitin deacetylase (PgdA/CDA1 family)
MNAVASLAATTSKAYDFVEELWKVTPPTGQYRYYDGCLYMFGLLHCSGNYKIWGATQASTPPSNPPTNPPTNPPSGAIEDLNKDGAINMTDVMIVAGVFNSASGDSKYVKAYDLNSDNAINMTDVMMIAAKFNTVVGYTSNPPSPTATTRPSPSTSPVPSIPAGAKLVALTFDDGPSTQTTKTLDKLKKYNVKATFMLIGSKIASADAVMKRIVSEGHECGNHSWEYSGMSNMQASQITDSINKTNAAIKQYTGSDPKFFRAPNLAISQTMLSTIRLTFVQGVICDDWQGGSAASSAQLIANKAISGVRDGSIVLLHSDQPEPHYTPDALDTIIPSLQQKGYYFVTLSDLFKLKGKTPPLGVNIDGAF